MLWKNAFLLVTQGKIVVTMESTPENALMADVVGCQHKNQMLLGAFTLVKF